jgi:hypothetical protein
MMRFVLAHLSAVLKGTLHKYNSFSSLSHGTIHACAMMDNKLLYLCPSVSFRNAIKKLGTLSHFFHIPVVAMATIIL